jgi:hypothetical protein
MTLKRHEILGKNLYNSLEECKRCLEKLEAMNLESIAPGKPQQESGRRSQIDCAVIWAVLEHLGYGPIENLAGLLNQGVDRAIEYFYGDWYYDWFHPDEFAKIASGNALDPLWPHKAIMCTGVLPDALLLGGLTGRWDDVTKICSWYNANIDLERQGDLIEDPDTQLYLCIACSLSSTPMPGVDAMLAKVKANRSSRDKRLRLLCAVWEAALAKDQKAFDKSLKDSVTYFLKAEAEDVPNMCFWVALRSSFMWLLAERNGLAFPELPGQIDAAIVRRQTIGLA